MAASTLEEIREHAESLRRWGTNNLSHQSHYAPYARQAAPKLLDAARRLAPDERLALSELLGWCDAIVAGWVFEHGFDPSELSELIDEVLPPLAEAEPDPPSSFETATAEHAVGMTVLHALSLLTAGFSNTDPFRLSGTLKRGSYAFSDQSESNFAVCWDKSGVVAVAFHKYGERLDGGIATALPGLPTELAPLAARIATMMGEWCTVGLWITRDGRRGRLQGHGEDDGSSYLEALTSTPREALFGRPRGGLEFARERGELARSLALRILSGGGAISDEESSQLVDGTTTPADLRKTATLLRSFGLRWPEVSTMDSRTGRPPRKRR